MVSTSACSEEDGSAGQSHFRKISPVMDSPLSSIPGSFALEPSTDCLAGGGALGAVMREFDWSATPVGPAAHWPANLRVAVGLCLSSRMPAVLWWGRERRTMFYNDAFQMIAGGSAPAESLGRSGRDCRGDHWDILELLVDRVFCTGAPASSEDQLLVVDRDVPR